MNAQSIKKTVLSLGYVYFEDKAKKSYDLNIIGIRNSSTGKKVTNLFDDKLTVTFIDENGNEVYKEWDITTDPGAKAMKEYHNPKGVFRLKPGQYRRFWAIGKHQGKYTALVQIGTAIGWRDSDKNMTFSEEEVDKGYGINCHRSNPKTQSQYVENWSEGCQVFKRKADFDEFMAICEKAKELHGNSFTYTLLESNQLL